MTVSQPRTHRVPCAVLCVALALASCNDGGGTGPGLPVIAGAPIGADHTGQYHLGPVDFEESVWHNACAPYPSAIRNITGNMLAGVSNTVVPPAAYCDACIEVTTDAGRTAIMRVVTYGVSNATGDLDLSPAAFDALHLGEYPRAMKWHLVACDNGAPLYLQFQTGASQWWTSLWVRNPSMAIDHVAVQSSKHASFFTLSRNTDGTYNDQNGFGDGPFTIRVVGVTGAYHDIDVASVVPGALVAADGNIPLAAP